jgi:hypothetical protein
MTKDVVAWYSQMGEIEELVKAKNYEVDEWGPVLSLSLPEVCSSPEVEKLMKEGMRGLDCLALGELWTYQKNEILQLLRKKGVERDLPWLDGFEQELSQVVYNGHEFLGVLLCTAGEDGIFVQLFMSMAAPAAVSLLSGFLSLAWSWEEGADGIYMVVMEPSVLDMMKKMLSKKCRKKELGRIHSISRETAEGDTEFLEAYRNAAGKSPIHDNIVWKVRVI